VLVHHADAGLDGVGRRAEPHRRAVDLDRPLVRLLHAIEDLHEGGLAGAVLAADRVDLPAAHGEVYVAVGHHAGEPLGDATQHHRVGRWIGAVVHAGLTLSPRAECAVITG
jgi:hypothetical protein